MSYGSSGVGKSWSPGREEGCPCELTPEQKKKFDENWNEIRKNAGQENETHEERCKRLGMTEVSPGRWKKTY